MTLPANIRVNVAAVFPSRVRGSGPITIAKANGIWTIGFSFVTLGNITVPPIPDYPTDYILVYDSVAQLYFRMSLAAFAAAASGTNYRIVTAAGAIASLSSDGTVLVNKTAGAATTYNAPTSASRAGLPITLKDYKGDANTNNIRFVMAAGETLDGQSQTAADAAFSTIIDINYGAKTFYPLTAGGWYTK